MLPYTGTYIDWHKIETGLIPSKATKRTMYILINWYFSQTRLFKRKYSQFRSVDISVNSLEATSYSLPRLKYSTTLSGQFVNNMIKIRSVSWFVAYCIVRVSYSFSRILLSWNSKQKDQNSYTISIKGTSIAKLHLLSYILMIQITIRRRLTQLCTIWNYEGILYD